MNIRCIAIAMVVVIGALGGRVFVGSARADLIFHDSFSDGDFGGPFPRDLGPVGGEAWSIQRIVGW